MLLGVTEATSLGHSGTRSGTRLGVALPAGMCPQLLGSAGDGSPGPFALFCPERWSGTLLGPETAFGWRGGMSSLGGGCQGWAWPRCPRAGHVPLSHRSALPCPSLSSQHAASLPALPPGMPPRPAPCLSRALGSPRAAFPSSTALSVPHTSSFSSSLDAMGVRPPHPCLLPRARQGRPHVLGAGPRVTAPASHRAWASRAFGPTGYKLGVPASPTFGLKIRS